MALLFLSLAKIYAAPSLSLSILTLLYSLRHVDFFPFMAIVVFLFLFLCFPHFSRSILTMSECAFLLHFALVPAHLFSEALFLFRVGFQTSSGISSCLSGSLVRRVVFSSAFLIGISFRLHPRWCLRHWQGGRLIIFFFVYRVCFLKPPSVWFFILPFLTVLGVCLLLTATFFPRFGFLFSAKQF